MISAQQFLLHDSQCFYRCIFNKTRREIVPQCSLSGVHFPIEIMSAVFHLQSPVFSNQLTILIVQEQLFTQLGKWDRKHYFLSSLKMKTLIFQTVFNIENTHNRKVRQFETQSACQRRLALRVAYIHFPVFPQSPWKPGVITVLHLCVDKPSSDSFRLFFNQIFIQPGSCKSYYFSEVETKHWL